MGKLEDLIAYTDAWMPEYNRLIATLELFGRVEKPATIRPVARMWFEAGVPAIEAVEWFAAGFTPDAAVKLREAGSTPHIAREVELAAADAADGGDRLADYRTLCQQIADAETLAMLDPDEPDHNTIRPGE